MRCSRNKNRGYIRAVSLLKKSPKVPDAEEYLNGGGAGWQRVVDYRFG